MGMFSRKPPKRITPREMKRKVRTAMFHKKFTKRQRDFVEATFGGDMDEKGIYKGIDEGELKKGLERLEKTKDLHRISDSKLQSLKENLYKNL